MTLNGFLKVKEVSDGYAGLWVRADDAKGQVLDMDNMQDRGLSGTADWTEATVTLNLPKEVAQICAGALLTGKGQVWVDDLVITKKP